MNTAVKYEPKFGRSLRVARKPQRWTSCTAILTGLLLALSTSQVQADEPDADATTDANRLAQVRAKHDQPYVYAKSHKPDYLFDQDALRRYDIFLEDADLKFLNDNPVREQYVKAALLFEGKLLSHVGVRYKGEHGSFEHFVKDFKGGERGVASSGPKLASKLSLKVKVNWKNKKDKFYGVKKLQFHSMNHDRGMMRERLYWWLLREFGSPVPRCVHAKVYINGKYSGIYALTEQVDGRFADHHFKDGDGNLYKSVWPIDPNNTLKPEKYLKAALKTNEEAGDVSRFQTFAQDVLDANPSQVDSVMNRWFDVEQLMWLYVVMNTLGHHDSAVFGGCGYGPSPNANFYWYVESQKKRVHLIPWDMDQEIGGPGYVGRHESSQSGDDLDSRQEEEHEEDDEQEDRDQDDDDDADIDNGTPESQYVGPSRDKLVLGLRSYFKGPKCERLYEQFLREYYNSKYINPLLDKWSAQIEDAVAEASELYNDVPSVDQQKQAVQVLKWIVANFDKDDPPGCLW